ncbi:hypothetical protein SGLAM104S_08439 [Streptomyces glaucescens]
MTRTRLHSRRYVKSYVRHSSGEQMWTGAVEGGNVFGTEYVHFNVSGVARAREGAVHLRGPAGHHGVRLRPTADAAGRAVRPR